MESARDSWGARRWAAMSSGESGGQARSDIRDNRLGHRCCDFVQRSRRRSHRRRSHFRQGRRCSSVVERLALVVDRCRRHCRVRSARSSGGHDLGRLTAARHYSGDFVGAARSEWGPGPPEERPYDVELVRQQFARMNAEDALEHGGKAQLNEGRSMASSSSTNGWGGVTRSKRTCSRLSTLVRASERSRGDPRRPPYIERDDISRGAPFRSRRRQGSMCCHWCSASDGWLLSTATRDATGTLTVQRLVAAALRTL
jgi:hypothetical protein